MTKKALLAILEKIRMEGAMARKQGLPLSANPIKEMELVADVFFKNAWEHGWLGKTNT